MKKEFYVKDLSGHSGCKVLLYKDKEGKYFVRKISASKDYNSRLKKQMLKQKFFYENIATEKIKAPRIYSSGEKEGLFYFDMEYILGETLIKYISQTNTYEFKKIAEGLIQIIKVSKAHNSKEITDLKESFEEKIDQLKDIIPREYLDLLNKLRARSANLPKVVKTFCHGDLTLENIIYNPHTETFTLVDFQDIFTEHYWFDISILFQDISEVWFFLMSKEYDPKTMKIKMDLLKKEIAPKINDLEKTYFKYHSLLVAMKFFRIIPYANETNHGYLGMVIQKHLGISKKIIKPNLFLIGHPQSGVRELYYILKQHPEVLVSYPHEPNYFCEDFNKEIEEYYKKKMIKFSDARPKSDEEYTLWFPGEKGQKIIVDGSTNYLYSKVAAKKIKEFNPKTKLLIVLRNPRKLIYNIYKKKLPEFRIDIQPVFGYTKIHQEFSVNGHSSTDYANQFGLLTYLWLPLTNERIFF